jgi:putative restriction endonuclease
VLFRKEDWIGVPENWANSIVQGKSYTTDEPLGNQLWNNVNEVLLRYEANRPMAKAGDQLVFEHDAPLYSNSILTKVRVGQGAFRVLVIDGYQRRCSISGERTLPVLEAAHIKPYAQSGPNALSNGILLRSDMHKLFDSGYLTVTTDLIVEVSSRINQEFSNGKEYYKFHGQKLLHLPSVEMERPNSSFLEWHNSNCYKG